MLSRGRLFCFSFCRLVGCFCFVGCGGFRNLTSWQWRGAFLVAAVFCFCFHVAKAFFHVCTWLYVEAAWGVVEHDDCRFLDNNQWTAMNAQCRWALAWPLWLSSPDTKPSHNCSYKQFYEIKSQFHPQITPK
jgi:hypothetical protein